MRIIEPLFDLEFNAPTITDSIANFHIPQGEKTIVPDYIERKILEKQEQYKGPPILKKSSPLEKDINIYNGQDLTGKILLIIRSGGIGDLLFITPTARFLKNKYPTCKIILICDRRYIPAFKGLPFFDHNLRIPTPLKEVEKFVGFPISKANTFFVSFEGLIEEGGGAKTKNAYDLFKEKFGIKEEIDYHPEIILDEELDAKVKAIVNRDRLNIAIQPTASSPIRTWRDVHIAEFLNLINFDRETTIWIVDSPTKTKYIENNILSRVRNKNPKIEFINFSKQSVSLLHSIALFKNMDLIIGPDSSALHIAACFNIPLVGIFSPFHTALRLKYYKNALGLDLNSDCQFADNEYHSCFQHGHICLNAQRLNRIFSPCMDLMRPETVYERVEQFLVNDLKLLDAAKTIFTFDGRK